MARDPLRPPGRRSWLGRIARTIAIALLVAFAVGFLIGTLLRGELEKPVRYIGAVHVTAPALARGSTCDS